MFAWSNKQIVKKTMANIDKGLIMTALTEVRKSQGKTQKDIADHLGVQRQTVAAWENEEKTAFPTIKQAEEIAIYLGFELKLIIKNQ